MLDFLKKKNGPFQNRYFYKEFFQEQDKHEKLEVLETVSNKLAQVFKEEAFTFKEGADHFSDEVPKGLQNMQKYMNKNTGMKDLKLSIREKNMLLQKLKEEERIRREN